VSHEASRPSLELGIVTSPVLSNVREGSSAGELTEIWGGDSLISVALRTFGARLVSDELSQCRSTSRWQDSTVCGSPTKAFRRSRKRAVACATAGSDVAGRTRKSRAARSGSEAETSRRRGELLLQKLAPTKDVRS
jgi:hypothetical protein